MGLDEFTGSSFSEFLRQNKLMGSRCQNCGAIHLPPRAFCPECHQGQMVWIELSGKGKLIAFTVIHIAPTAMIEAGYGRENPYCSGVVQLEEGPSISAQILGVDVHQPEAISIGIPLSVEFVERGQGEDTRTFLAFRAN